MVAALRDLRQRPVALPSMFVVGVVALGIGLVFGWAQWIGAVAILVPTALASYRRPQRGVLVFAAILPFDGMIKALGPAAADSWKQVFIVGLLALTFMCPPEARSQGHRKLPGWVPAFIGLVALGLASAFFVDRTTAITGLRISYFSVLLAVVVWRCPLDRRERDHLVSIFMFMAVFTSLVGLWQQVVGHEYLASLGYQYDENIRFTVGFTLRSFSTFNLPFSFGFYLMLAVLIGLPMALAEPRRLRSKLFFLSLPIIAAGMLFSFVRGAMLGLAIGLLYLAFHRYKLLVWGIPLVLVAALFIPAGATLTGAVFGSTSLGDRTTSWSDRFEQIVEHPFGSGIGTTGAAADRTAILKKTNRDLAFQPDNSYLKVTFELGVIGLWLLVMMLVSMFLFTRVVERRVEGIDRDFVAGVSAQWLAIMASSLVATYLELVPMDQLFWLMIAIVATMAPDFEPGPAIGGDAQSVAAQR
ncbi:MAG: O-antigen ligase family protein [Acidimicrobiia bacterium]